MNYLLSSEVLRHKTIHINIIFSTKSKLPFNTEVNELDAISTIVFVNSEEVCNDVHTNLGKEEAPH